MKEMKISSFLLERYRLGELDPDDNLKVRNALAADPQLRSSLEQLDESDRELRQRYPFESLGLPKTDLSKPKVKPFPAIYRIGIIAAAVVLCALFPVLHYVQNSRTAAEAASFLPDRPKGTGRSSAELSIYLKGSEDPLADQSLLREGNTVQLAYTAPAGDKLYGVIFSIDGRSQVTMHYPYRKGQSSQLVSGRKTFLTEAYTLDDAPDYELFIMVISDKPLDSDAILAQAGILAKGGAPVLKILEENSSAVFKNYKISFAAIRKG
ncbi:MAG: hypothetical protein FWF22_10175 [Treponema sp.]|nr:hypothetical protein [Treponema sp.]